MPPEQYRSVAHLLEESFRKHAASPFSVCMDQWMSYGELERLSAALGAYLQGLGLEPGARVAIMLPNVPQFGVTMAAVLRAGYTCVNVNPLYTARELEHQLKDSGATAIVILENFAHTLSEIVDHTAVQHVVMASMGDLLGFWYGRWITFAVRHLAKMVPAYDLPLSAGRTLVTFRQALSDGARRTLTASSDTGPAAVSELGMVRVRRSVTAAATSTGVSVAARSNCVGGGPAITTPSCGAAVAGSAMATSGCAGMVAASLAAVPGCSAVLRGAVVAYQPDIKASLLGVPQSALDEGVVSERVALGLARGARGLLGADVGIGTTGAG